MDTTGRTSIETFRLVHRRGEGCLGLVLALVFVALLPPPAQGEEPSLWTRDTVSGDWGGVRTQLSQRGIDFDLTYTGEVFANLSGGLQRGAAYEDLIRFQVDADLEKLIGWRGGSARVAVDQIDNGGRNAEDLVGALSDPSNIDARPTTRLLTLWVQRELGDAGSARIGQLDASNDFLVSSTASGLINNTFAWANIVDVNLPGGGPAFPLPAPGARLKLTPGRDIRALAAVFSGDPAGACREDEDPQVCNKHGTTFSFTGGALFLGEVQYWPHAASRPDIAQSSYKLGGFYHTGDFADQSRGNGNNGQIVSLAVDDSDPLEHQGNWGVYGIVDHSVWRNGPRGVAVFWRGAVVPKDRNLVSWYMDGGFAVMGPLRARRHDTLAFGVAYSNISSDAANLDGIRQRIRGSAFPIRNGETAFELTYKMQLAPWWTVQPDLQYIVHPGGNIPDPDDPDTVIEDSFLIGLRTKLTF